MEVPNQEQQLIDEIRKRALSRSEAIARIRQICPGKRALLAYCFICLDDTNYAYELKAGVIHGAMNSIQADISRDFMCGGGISYDEYCTVHCIVDTFNLMAKKLGQSYYDLDHLSLVTELETTAAESGNLRVLEFFQRHRLSSIKLK